MGGTYGQSRAKKLVQDGKYEEAIAEATRAFEQGDAAAEALVDRAQAYVALQRPAEAAADLEAAVGADEDGELDLDAVDDAFFSALLEVARKENNADRLAHYAKVFPTGQHGKDVIEWQRRLRGEIAPQVIIKERD